MGKELAKTYDPHGLEDRIYQKWLEKKYFHAEADRSKKPFTIVIPPPNITGQLHMGHALDNTMQDILIRFKRMQGYNALWQPGTDHASIATEVKIIEKLKEEGIDKHDLGREKFLERAWDWKREYGGRIISQLKKLGSSCDWDRERFTMDEGCNKAVTEVFCKMHEKGYIYKGARMINWCPVCNTSISDAEVEYEEQAGHLWHIKYPVLNDDGSESGEYLTFATTRPETMLGDTAVAIHPDDERYAHLRGKKLMLPLMNREIPVVEDTYVDMEFGTGVVKITPAHDPNDFEVGKRHDLPIVNIMNDDATINENGGKYAGMERYAARKAIVEELDSMGLLVKVEDYSHNVGTHDRCKDLEYFYPTDVLVTGYDIIFFWVIRMIFSGYEHMGEKPFKTVLFHGLVRDSQGRKMSKSLGNGIDPLEVIEQYGADALRMTLITGNAPGNDMRFYYERVEANRNFANKIWNASRFIMMNMEGKEVTDASDFLEPSDRWIMSKLNSLVREVTDNMEHFELGIAVQKIYDFIWDEFCDWYIEMVKPRLYNSDDAVSQNAALWTLKSVLIDALKLLHPYMPFITEEIFCSLQSAEESIMVSRWPEYVQARNFAADEKDIEIIKEAVRGIRNVRSEMNVAPSKKARVFVVSDKAEVRETFEEGKLFFASLAWASEVTIQGDREGIADDAVSVVIANANIYIPFAELVDIAQEIERLEKESKRLDGELARVNGMLNNEKFMSKAPEAKIAEEKGKLAKYVQMKEQITERLAQLR